MRKQNLQSMKKFLFALLFCCSVVGQSFAQQKGTLDFLEHRPGIYPVMLNDSVTKHLQVLELLGDVKNGGGYVRLDEDYCVLETANLEEVLATFKNYKINTILFYVSPTFKNECLEQLKKLYGEPKVKEQQFCWEKGDIILTYELNPSDAKKPGQAIGLFMRRQDL